jgi:hypothetical protein
MKGVIVEVPPITLNFSMFGLIFTAKKYVDSARLIVAQELQENAEWRPVGKYLACHSIELSLKAFLALKGQKVNSLKKAFNHRIAQLVEETERLDCKSSSN